MDTYCQGLSVNGRDVVKVWKDEMPSVAHQILSEAKSGYELSSWRLELQLEAGIRCKSRCYIVDKAKLGSGAGSCMGLESLGSSDIFKKPQ